MFAYLRCPNHGEALRREGDVLIAEGCEEQFPIVDGIPVLIADAAERRAVVEPSSKGETRPGALDFYNHREELSEYSRDQMEHVRREVELWQGRAECDGPVLEIGSGRGALQGIGEDYCACDYSLTLLRGYVRAERGRVCATAEHLPFPDATFRFIFSVAALEHVPRVDRAFAEIHRVLKPGGLVYLAPAWHCTQFNCEGIPVRPYRDLDARQKFVKATLPIRTNVAFKAMTTLPGRVLRRALWSLSRRPTTLSFTPLRPDYVTYWTSDSDAAARIDSHEGCLFFHSRDYELLSPGPSPLAQMLMRAGAVAARKPARPSA